MVFKCKKCGSVKYLTKEKGNQLGLYCADCGAWHKWLNASEKQSLATDNLESKACVFCQYNEMVVPTSWGDGCITGWLHIPSKVCPVCGKPKEV